MGSEMCIRDRELTEPVRVKKNRYLCAAHETQLEDGRKVLAYLLDVDELRPWRKEEA